MFLATSDGRILLIQLLLLLLLLLPAEADRVIIYTDMILVVVLVRHEPNVCIDMHVYSLMYISI